jgi:hypothetical protein
MLGQSVPPSKLSMDANSGSHHIEIKSWLFVVPVFVLKWSFRAVLPRDAVLSWRQQRHCLGILLYVFIFRPPLQASMQKIERRNSIVQ